MANRNLQSAKSAKNDEFYTQFADIQKEVNAYLEYNPDVFRGKTVLCPCDDPEWSNFTKFFAQNFDSFGLKKLISTSYAYDSKSPRPEFDWQPTLFESENPAYDAAKSPKKGKIFTLTDEEEPPRDINKLKWRYLEGDGDFRSDEVKKLYDEADIIVTNPPFSLFREFIAWTTQSEAKKFLVIGNMNAITYKEVFALIQKNKLWLGRGFAGGNAYFGIPQESKRNYVEGVFDSESNLVKFRNCNWFTNMEHGRRHDKLQTMTMQENLRFARHKEIKEYGYPRYDNYDAIEVPYTDAIPSDYEGVMGVPISFLYKYCPDQFEILGMCENEDLYNLKTRVYTTDECKAAYMKKFGKKGTYDLNASGVLTIDGIQEKVYQRLLIRKKNSQENP